MLSELRTRGTVTRTVGSDITKVGNTFVGSPSSDLNNISVLHCIPRTPVSSIYEFQLYFKWMLGVQSFRSLGCNHSNTSPADCHPYTYTSTCAHTCAHTHAHACTRTHTYIHMHAHTSSLPLKAIAQEYVVLFFLLFLRRLPKVWTFVKENTV